MKQVALADWILAYHDDISRERDIEVGEIPKIFNCYS
jgi:hypothetical protein